MEKIKSYDIFLVSNTLFGNEKYITNYVINNNDKCNIIDKKWNRIIIDEAHELINCENVFSISGNLYDKSLQYYRKYKPNIISKYYLGNSIDRSKEAYNLKKKEKYTAFNILYNLKSNYRWCLTATPFLNGINNLISYFYWLSDYEFNVNITNYDELLNIHNELSNTNNYKPYDNISDLVNNKYSYDNMVTLMMNGLFNNLTSNDFANFTKTYISKIIKLIYRIIQ